MPTDDNFYEEIPAADANADVPKGDDATEEVADTRAHILSPEELEAWKNGEDEGPVLRRSADLPAEDEPVEEDPKAKVVEPVTPAATSEAPVLPQVQAVDPGEYVPNDYSFDVTIYDADGNKPRSVKVSSVEDFDKLLEDDSNFGSYAALAKAQRAADRMESNTERDITRWESDKANYELEVGSITERNETLTNIANEMNYLVGRGDLPAISKDLQEANWSDPEIASQDGVKEQLALLAYMERESAVRVRAGLAPMTSALEAWTAMQLDEARSGATTAKQQAATARKAAGARVGGSQAAQSTSVPKGIAVGRVNPGGLRDMGVR